MEDKMKRFKFNLSIYFHMFAATLKSMMEYRFDFLVGTIAQMLTQLVELIFIWIVFQNTATLVGWTKEELLLLYGVSMICISIVDLLFDSMYDIGPKYIKDGEFDKILLRPVHPLLSIMGESRAANFMGYLLIGFGLTISMLIRLQIPITFLLILKILGFALIGGLIIGAIEVIFSVASFWTHRANEIIWSAYRMHTFTQYPIQIYNRFIRVIVTCLLPFAFSAYYPVANYLQKEDGNWAYLSILVLIVLWLIAIKIWNWGLSKYRSTGN